MNRKELNDMADILIRPTPTLADNRSGSNAKTTNKKATNKKPDNDGHWIGAQMSEVGKMLKELTIQKGAPLTDDEIEEFYKKYRDMISVDPTSLKKKYKTLVDFYQDDIGFDSDGTPVTKMVYRDGKLVEEQVGSPQDVWSRIVNRDLTPPDNLMLDPKGAQAQQYKYDMYSAIAQQEAEYLRALGAAEVDAYRMLAAKQQELEDQIAATRMKYIRAGATTNQLAVQDLNNLLMSQQMAQGIASQVLQERANMGRQFAQQRANVTGSMYDIINQNQAVQAQNYATYLNWDATKYNTAYQFAAHPDGLDLYKKFFEK